MSEATQYPRPPIALIALKRFNGLADDAPVPPAWGYFPNAWMRDNWQALYGHLVADLHTDCCPALALTVLGQNEMAAQAARECGGENV